MNGVGDDVFDQAGVNEPPCMVGYRGSTVEMAAPCDGVFERDDIVGGVGPHDARENVSM
jgi:hypothetical protein